MSVNCPYNNNTDQQDVETSVNSYSWSVQQQAEIQAELNDAMASLQTMEYGPQGSSTQNNSPSSSDSPQDKDRLDKCFMYVCQVVFGLILDVSTAQQNVYANSENVSSSIGALTAHVQDLEAKGANYDPATPNSGMTQDDGVDFYEASADLQWDLNCTSYSYADAPAIAGNYLQGAMDADSRKEISDANISIMDTYGIIPAAFDGQPVGTTFTLLGGTVPSTGAAIATISNNLWTSTTSDGTSTPTTPGQALDPRQTNMNDRFSTQSTIANSTESTFNMRLQATITDTNTDMGTESEIQKMIIDSNEQRIKSQKSG